MGIMTVLLVRAPYAVAQLRSSEFWPGDFSDETDCGDGWRAAFSDHHPQDLDGAVQAYLRETGCPALLILTLNGRCSLVYSAVPGGPTRLAILGLRTAMADGVDTTGYQVAETRHRTASGDARQGAVPRRR
jgi:hypothetical protein